MHSRLRPSPAMVIALIALFVSLGGTAAALSGSNTVFSDDIVDNQVYSADVRNDTLAGGGLAAPDLRPSSVGTSEVALDSLGALDLAPSSVGTSEAADNSLTGTDINESLLGIVPNADQLDGKDSSQFPAVHFGASPQNALSNGVVVEWSDLGASFRTDGDADLDNTIRIYNTRSSGSIRLVSLGGPETPIAPGAFVTFPLAAAHIVVDPAGTRSWFVVCGGETSTSSLRCHGVASHATP